VVHATETLGCYLKIQVTRPQDTSFYTY